MRLVNGPTFYKMIISYLHVLFRSCLLLSILTHSLGENQGSQKRNNLAGLHTISLFIISSAKYVLSFSSVPGPLLGAGVGYRGEIDKGSPLRSCHLAGETDDKQVNRHRK